MSTYCLSCGSPLWMDDFKGPAEHYCRHCTNENGQLKSLEDVRMGTAQWLKSWQPNLDDQKAMERASCYLKAMPAWADSGTVRNEG